MTGMIDLRKKVEIVLAKRKINNVTARVGLAIDISGSMQNLYRAGVVQAVVDRILALATKFDDNGELDIWTFDHRVAQLDPVTEAEFGNYVNRAILENRKLDKWGATSYAPPIESILDEYFPARTRVEKSGGFFGLFQKKTVIKEVDKPGKPAVVIFITDGENDDQRATTALLEESQDRAIYYQFVGIGRANFSYLESVGDKYPNTGFFQIPDITTISDEKLYDDLVNDELAAWLAKGAAL